HPPTHYSFLLTCLPSSPPSVLAPSPRGLASRRPPRPTSAGRYGARSRRSVGASLSTVSSPTAVPCSRRTSSSSSTRITPSRRRSPRSVELSSTSVGRNAASGLSSTAIRRSLLGGARRRLPLGSI
ncbi:hypothetical protein OF83DRAFT_1284321, partial [Amylostereum chailletii]